MVGTRGVEAIDRTLAPEGRRNGRRAQESVTIEDVYEPYLMQQGLLIRTPKGRQATERAYEHLGIFHEPMNS